MKSQAQNTASPYHDGWFERITEVLGTKRSGEIADILRLSPGSVSDWKHGRTKPSLETLQSIAFYGESTVDYLIYGDAEHRHQKGDPIYFERALLPADYRTKLEELAHNRSLEPGELALQLLIRAIDEEAELFERVRSMVSGASPGLEDSVDLVKAEMIIAREIALNFDDANEKVKTTKKARAE